MRIVALVCLLCGLAEPLIASTGSDCYSAGLAAARAGDLQAALEHFEAARRAGVDTPTLTYNLGVVSFRLNDLGQARVAFIRLAGNPRWQALAHYNLGLIEERDNRPRTAQRHFRRSLALADSPKLRALAERKLLQQAGEQSQEPRSAPRGPARWSALASLAAGYDDNVVLASDQLLDRVSGEDDTFAELLAAAGGALWGASHRGAALDVNAYHRGYRELDEFDFSALSMGLQWHGSGGRRAWSTGPRVEIQFVGGDRYASVATYRVELAGDAGPVSLRLRNDVSYLSGAGSFDFVGGWRNRARIQALRQVQMVSLRAGYELELNDRNDLREAERFLSYSPRRHRLYGSIGVQATERTDLELTAGLRASTYPDDDRFVDDNGTQVEGPRDQDIVEIGLRAGYRLSARWWLWSQYQWTDSDSALGPHDYTTHQILLGLETVF